MVSTELHSARWASAPELEEVQRCVLGTREEVMACLLVQDVFRRLQARRATSQDVLEVHVQLHDQDLGATLVPKDLGASTSSGARSACGSGLRGGADMEGAAQAGTPPQPITAYDFGWGRAGLVDEIEARWAKMVDLPIEEATRDAGTPITAAEEENIPKLSAALLQRLGLDAPPEDFRASHFTRWKLLLMLRARGGELDKAVDRAMECFPGVELALAHARAFEQAPPLIRELRARWLPSGPFGLDKRGAPVMYGRLGMSDVAGSMRGPLTQPTQPLVLTPSRFLPRPATHCSHSRPIFARLLTASPLVV